MTDKTEKDFRISKTGLSDYEADTLFPIALNIDLCFRKSVYQYDIHNSDEQKQREKIADIIYNCESAEIKRLLQKINTQESRSILNMIADYERTYAKSFYTLYKLKPEYKSEQSGSVEKMRREHNYIDKSKYFPAYSEKIKKDTEPMGIDLYLLAAYAADKSSYTAEHKDVIVITRNRTESAYFNELSGYVPVPEFMAVQMKAAAISNYNGYSAFIGNDGGVYLGKSENYMFNRENGYLPFYKNTNNSLLFVSDNKAMFQFISGTGWTLSQAEILKKGFFTENDYAEFAKLEKGVLSQFEQIREIRFADKPFNYLETAEKQTEQNYNKIDGIINNEPSESEDKNMNDKISVLAVEPMKTPYIKEIEPGLESLQKEVGGLIQATYPYEDMVAIVCNEEGKINGLPLNRAIYDDDKEMIDIIAGTFLVVGLGENNFTSLSDDLQKKYADIFKNPEEFVRLGNEIVAIPVKPSIKQQLNQAKKEQGEHEDKKPPSHKPPEL